MPVLQKTLDYLFHDVMDREGMEKSHAFIRDRTRAVRSDIVIQHLRDPGTMECFDRCARFHILAMHKLRGTEGFNPTMEDQMIMNGEPNVNDQMPLLIGLYSHSKSERILLGLTGHLSIAYRTRNAALPSSHAYPERE